ncbi:helix-hairpin-helix domain-containing protein [Clostridium cylindrosporum]|uniref:Helix-hairpin-helix DNA-binding motif class 1 domain-containing protein n=1 Tax=Clostridium cylindrosporum DSM 605 TaxID=1121307 RepID=A0A0J8D6T2_CLOCY|nr:ComEA family DNA-binding protein [Clostridium cylindrosporum]KMT21562.1 hypothetical protein CLCY_2c03240 [Clostridium cylindrosporum DSM 605]
MDIKITKKQRVGIIVFLFIIFGITSFIYIKNKTSIPKDEIKKNRVLVEEMKDKDETVKQNKEYTSSTFKSIKAYICGYVVNPGVYALKEGDRLDDLVKLAGGFTKEADPEGINLAYEIKDQDYFKILSAKETKDKAVEQQVDSQGLGVGTTKSGDSNSKQKEDSEKININKASKEELKNLPRIGDALSQRIIDFRETEGGFKTIEDIKEVGGIGDKMFENLKDKITVE